VESPFRDTADVKLIETLRWENGAFPRLSGHMARMAAGAATLGRSFDPQAAEAALRAAAPNGAARMRLTLDAASRLEAEAAPLPPTRPEWRLGLAAAKLASDDPWLRLKTTRRAAYDAARAALPPHLDEYIFGNELAETCDGTITTLFFDAGEGLQTPPLRCGLLPGVLRAEMLETGRVTEAVLPLSALGDVRLWVGNSLRGLIPARFIG
jgi:4-amino-4-deoxychorismate lyase